MTRSLRCSAAPGLDECADPQGYAWLVTFLDAAGDQHTTFASRYQPVSAHRLSIDGLHLLSCKDADRAECSKSVEVAVATGSVQEEQTFSCFREDTEPKGGYFRVEFMGVVSARIETGVALTRAASLDGNSLENALEDMGVLGGVTLTSTNATRLECRGENITITFDTFRGDAPPLLLSSSLSSGMVAGWSRRLWNSSSSKSRSVGASDATLADWAARFFALRFLPAPRRAAAPSRPPPCPTARRGCWSPSRGTSPAPPC